MAQFADQFAEARTTTSSFLTQKRFGFERNQQNNRQNNDRQYQPKDNVQATSTNQRGCFICGRFGHKANECDSRRPDLVMAVMAPRNPVTIIHDTEIRIQVQLDSKLTTETMKNSKEINDMEIIDKAKDRQ